MNKIVSRCMIIVAIAAYITIGLCAPWAISDGNNFLKVFVNHEFLNLLGVIVAITLASTANLHLQFNRIEDEVEKTILPRTRLAVKRSASWMIGLFAVGFLLVLAKPLIVTGDISGAFVNGFAILIVLFNILILADITHLVFRIDPMFKMLGDQHEKNNP